MGEPDYSKLPVPKRLVTMSMADKYMAVCFIYDGKQYQNLCRVENPDGTFNYSEKCLSKLPSRFPFIGFESNTSIQSEQGLVRYSDQDQSEIPDIFDAISYYWIHILILCLLSAFTFNWFYMKFLRYRTSRLSRFFNYVTGARFSRYGNYRLSAGPTFYENGTISIGKISFNARVTLGLGSKGTCVFKGLFEGRHECAVKRVVSQHINLADREIDFLRTLQHPNLVRYLATEDDAQFVYIALELAEFTLGDLVERNRTDQIGLSKEELCRQSALGLQHLHSLNIVHRDIKPQNILISFPSKADNKRKVMISDFGLSKHLNKLNTTGYTSSSMRGDGTQGWMAPEVVNARKAQDRTHLPTKSADIFSLGCVFYYIISDGKHPFGQSDQRQANIDKDYSVLDKFDMNDKGFKYVSEDKAVMANKLIRTMIQSKPGDRPPISTILKHPLFWSHAEQLQFLQDVSDRIDKEERTSEILRRVERRSKEIFGYDWINCLSQDLQTDLRNFRKYKSNSTCHLLRAIRNKRHHYRELSAELKASLGEIPDGFMIYFSSRFPELIVHIYEAMQKCRQETIFRSYYEQSESFEFNRLFFDRIFMDKAGGSASGGGVVGGGDDNSKRKIEELCMLASSASQV